MAAATDSATATSPVSPPAPSTQVGTDALAAAKVYARQALTALPQ